MPGHGSAGPSPALDFLATIDARERGPGGTAAFAILSDADRATLERLLRSYHDQGLTPALERRVRTFLISYRELDRHAGVLDAAERQRLSRILDEPRRSARRPGVSWRWASAAAAVLLASGLGLGVRSYLSSSASGPPPVSAVPHPPGQAAPPVTTDLQNLRQDYGPWRQLTPSDQHPQTGSPALLLLEDGGYFASGRWTIAPDAPRWQQDLGGNVAAAAVTGDHADITDADGNPYLVGINQPFIISGNPGTVLRIDRAGAVLSLSLAQATAVRHPLGK